MGKLKEIIEKIKAALTQAWAKIAANPKLAKLLKRPASGQAQETKEANPNNPTILFKEGTLRTRLQLILVLGLLVGAIAGIWATTKFVFNRMQKHQTLQANSGQYQSQLEDFTNRVRDSASTISLGGFTTNTWDTQNQPVKVHLDLWARFSDPETAAYADTILVKINDRIAMALAKITEAKISILNDRGKKILREEIKRQVEPLLRQGKIAEVYFHNLVAQ